MSAADRIGGRPNYDDFVYVIFLSGCRLGTLPGVKLFDSSTAEWLDVSVQPPWLPSSHRSELSMAPCMPLASALPFRRHSLRLQCRELGLCKGKLRSLIAVAISWTRLPDKSHAPMLHVTRDFAAHCASIVVTCRAQCGQRTMKTLFMNH